MQNDVLVHISKAIYYIACMDTDNIKTELMNAVNILEVEKVEKSKHDTDRFSTATQKYPYQDEEGVLIQKPGDDSGAVY